MGRRSLTAVVAVLAPVIITLVIIVVWWLIVLKSGGESQQQLEIGGDDDVDGLANCPYRMLIGETQIAAGYYVCQPLKMKAVTGNCVISIGMSNRYVFEETLDYLIDRHECRTTIYDKRLLVPPSPNYFNIVRQYIEGDTLLNEFTTKRMDTSFSLMKVDMGVNGPDLITSTRSVLGLHPCQLLISVEGEKVKEFIDTMSSLSYRLFGSRKWRISSTKSIKYNLSFIRQKCNN